MWLAAAFILSGVSALMTAVAFAPWEGALFLGVAVLSFLWSLLLAAGYVAGSVRKNPLVVP